jgi:hypothetical protein
VRAPFVRTVAAADFDIVMFAGVAVVFTVVAALAQLVVEHDEPGAAGLFPPVGSTDA